MALALLLARPLAALSTLRRTPTLRRPSLLGSLSMGLSTTTKEAPKSMPITVLSGFLGAGKTTFLNHLLSNKKGIRYGLVVNDMATVNVDAKQIRSQNAGSDDGIDTMELQNGCVCCSLAEDLIASVAKLVSISENKKKPYDHIIVECSGIAEPRRIRELFQQAEDYGVDMMKHVKLDTLITLVDAEAFLQLFGTDQDIGSNRKLAYGEGGDFAPDDGNARRAVTELLLEQTECADIVLVNKCDLLKGANQVDLVCKVVASINPTAQVLSCVRGEVADPLALVGSCGGKGMALLGALDEHRNLVEAAQKEESRHASECSHPAHAHAHAHGHECSGSQCSHPAHGHGHECSGSQCSHPAHAHGHECSGSQCSHPAHAHGHECSGSQCSHPSHDHAHGHSHSHEHDHNHEMTTAQKRFGITSFVYKRRRPFHPLRFTQFLKGMGHVSVQGLHDVADGADQQTHVHEGGDAAMQQARRSLLRSKGFVWMGSSKLAAYFMSHAGQYLELNVLGRWWADIPQDQWPAGMEAEITGDFDGRYGDKRQEIVFIGMFGTDESSRLALEQALDACLLTDEELGQFDEIAATKGDPGLREHFVGKSK